MAQGKAEKRAGGAWSGLRARRGVPARAGWKKGRGTPLWADHWLAGALNDEVYDDEEWPAEDVTGAVPVD